MADKEKPKTVRVGDVLAKDKTEKPKSESKSAPKDGKKKTKHKHTHIEHHDDGSHTVRHQPMGGGEEVSYAAPDLDAVHDGLEQHVGDPNAGEEAAEPAAEAAAEPQAEAVAPKPGV